ncbi:MAG: hypothetical protein EOP05_07740 [Proteobacteria bacterium]|nr:MAG: hypothetical protein EOP05_07740 [Pseudomonadota bacterium]
MNPHRELNPQLFGAPTQSVEPGKLAADPRVPVSSVMGSPAEEPNRRVPYAPVDVKALEANLANLRGSVLGMEKRTETLAFKMEELARTVHARLERFSQAIVRVEDSQNKSHQESAQKFAMVAAKVNERKISDMKIQELVDRHNSIIRNFENRLLSMQRLVSEQEMSLHNAQAALDEARNEISRLKR